MSTADFGFRKVPVEEKKSLVKDVFDTVAEKYDLMNDLMSFFTHRLWKRYFTELADLRPDETALDIAGGTADIAMLLAAKTGGNSRVVVYDINRNMLEVGRNKCLDRGFVKNILFVRGDAEELPFEDNSFHRVTVAFGIRNVTDLAKALREMTRVAKPGGKVLSLEFSHVKNPLLDKLYELYSFSVIPALAEAVTGSGEPYRYLAESIRKFPDQEGFKKMMEEAGLFRVGYHNIFDGIAAVHMGWKV